MVYFNLSCLVKKWAGSNACHPYVTHCSEEQTESLWDYTDVLSERLGSSGLEKNLNLHFFCGQAALTFCLPGPDLLPLFVNDLVRG